MKPFLAACCALMVACAAFMAIRARAQSIAIVASPQFATFGMVGLGTGQTARLNAFALPTGGPIIAGGSCQVTFDFFDAAGKSLGTETLPVAQGAAIHYDLPRSAVAGSTDQLVEIRGALRAAFATPSATGTPVAAFCSILPTLEIYDSAGQTTVVLEQTRTLPFVTPL